MAKIIHVATPDWDWQGLYIDGKLVHEGHDIPIFTWLKVVGVGPTIEVDLDTESAEPFPANFDDLGLEDG